MKILGIVGSPRKGGNTDILVSRVLEGAKSKAAEVEKVHLQGLNIHPCQGAFSCEARKSCVLPDDMQSLYKKLQEADGIVIGTPVYVGNASGMLVNFLDRCRPFISFLDSPEVEKPALSPVEEKALRPKVTPGGNSGRIEQAGSGPGRGHIPVTPTKTNQPAPPAGPTADQLKAAESSKAANALFLQKKYCDGKSKIDEAVKLDAQPSYIELQNRLASACEAEGLYTDAKALYAEGQGGYCPAKAKMDEAVKRNPTNTDYIEFRKKTITGCNLYGQ